MENHAYSIKHYAVKEYADLLIHEITAEKIEWVWLNEVPEHEALKHWRNAE